MYLKIEIWLRYQLSQEIANLCHARLKIQSIHALPIFFQIGNQGGEAGSVHYNFYLTYIIQHNYSYYLLGM